MSALYFQLGPNTAEARMQHEAKLRSMGCSYCVHEERSEHQICSLGYTHHMPDAVCLLVNPRTPVERT